MNKSLFSSPDPKECAVKILLLEDDKLFNETLQDFLEEDGFKVFCTLDPYTALELTYKHTFDLYLFDVNLPYESGFDLLEKLRDSGDVTSTIFLTSREDKASLIEGFTAGADDYIRKPVDLDELSIRIKAVVRRQVREELLYIGSYQLNILTKVLYDSTSKQLNISHKAVELLVLLSGANGNLVSTDMIKNRLWSAGKSPSDGSLRVYISQLKKYFPNAIINMRGIGYIFDKSKV